MAFKQHWLVGSFGVCAAVVLCSSLLHGQSTETLHIYPLRNLAVGKLLVQVAPIVTDEKVKVKVDETTKHLVVMGDPTAVKAVERLLSKLDEAQLDFDSREDNPLEELDADEINDEQLRQLVVLLTKQVNELSQRVRMLEQSLE